MQSIGSLSASEAGGAPGAGDPPRAPPEPAAAPDGTEVGLAAAVAGKRSKWKPIILAVVLAGALTAVYCSPLKPWLKDVGKVRAALGQLGPWQYPAVVLAVACLVSCGTPRLLLCFAGGAVLGAWLGMALTQGGTLIGYYALFLFVRWGGRAWVMHRWPRLATLADRLGNQGIVGVILARQLPIHGSLTNLCMGLSKIKHRHFVIGTAIGLIPEAIPVSLVGEGVNKGSLADSAGYIGAAAVAFVVIWVACRYGFKALRKRKGQLAPG